MARAALHTLVFLVAELVIVSTPALLSAQVFQPQTRLAANLAGDTWEPSIAADRHGHVYVLIPDFPPSCKKCPSSINYLVVSNDNGKTWSTPRIIADPGSGQIDVQLKVDPIDGKTVYASWLQNSKSLIEVAKSTDFGQTWSNDSGRPFGRGWNGYAGFSAYAESGPLFGSVQAEYQHAPGGPGQGIRS